jgi:hypothetical protein
MEPLPVRGPAAHELGLALPPARMPLLHRRRPLKRWRWVGVFGPDLMLCAGDARVGPLPRRWWAIAEPSRPVVERTTLGSHGLVVEEGRVAFRGDDVRAELEIGDGDAIEIASPSAAGYIWTRKRAGVRARGTVELDGRSMEIDARAFIDESAGYHRRHTAWRWSAGVGRAESGDAVAWNLVTGVHDDPRASERTVWVDGRPREVGPVEFEDGLAGVRGGDGSELRFDAWSAREDHANLLVFRTDYRAPFGTFSGTLPGGIALAEGYGVMEEHDVYW